MTKFGISAATAALALAACDSASADQGVQNEPVAKIDQVALIKQSTDKVCYTNGTDQQLYFRVALGEVAGGGGLREPGMGACYHVPDIREIRVSIEKKSDVLCRVTPEYGVRYELTSLSGCIWKTSPA